MKSASAVFAALLFCTLLGGFGAGCKGTKTERISRVLADPLSFDRKDVTVAGRVTKVWDPSLGFLNIAAYQVDDGSGRIWVLSRNGAPSEGREVGLKARVRRDFKLGNEVLGAVLNEVERRER